MKRRHRSRSVLAVSLFPFLAVLICTLGVLIVLLVLAVKAADSQAVAEQGEADAKLKSQLNSVQLQLEERQIQIDGLKEVRPDALQRLEDARATRSHFENAVRQLQQEARSLAESLLALENQRQGMRAAEVPDSNLQQLRAQIDEAQKRLVQKREAAKQTPEVTWSIQPYNGNSGTSRRPIFVECRSDHIVIQPLDIKITQEDLRAAVFPGNMLDAALLTIREYWQRLDLEGDTGRAYPLIVVRPDGARTFQVVKASLKAWDDEYGYELVDADKKIDFGELDPALAEETVAAIEEAAHRQRRLAQVALQRKRQARRREFARRPGSERRPGLTVSPTGGGFVFNGVESKSDTDSERDFGSKHGKFTNSQASWQPNSGQHDSSAIAEVSVAGGVAGGTQAHGEKEWNSGQAEDGSTQQVEAATNANSPTESDAQAKSESPSESLAKTRGSNWALPSRSAGAVPYVRPLRIICFPNRLIIKGARGELSVPMDGATDEAVDELVNEIWTQIDSWGVAGQNSYWKPQLRITVMPGSHFRFAELRRLLADSGILIEGA